MKQIVVVSGKGGTGKTTVLASFAALAQKLAPVLADCDVDAANLYLLLHPKECSREEFWGAKIASRNEEMCTRCGACERHCRFDAITTEDIKPTACEGCGLCVLVCPAQALRLEPIVNGIVHTGLTPFGPMIYARLRPAAENSGRLVTRVRQEAENVALQQQARLILIDGPPGIGCTAIAALMDTDLAVIVTEPTLSARHDMERLLQLLRRLEVPAAVLLNKADINPKQAEALRDFCVQEQLLFLGELPYDEKVMQANAAQIPIVQFDNGPVAQGLHMAWKRLAHIMALETSHC